MPGFLLTTQAQVQCAHGGTAQSLLTNPRVKVAGQPIVTQSCVYSVSGCNQSPATTGIPTCVSAQWTSAATRVKANGIPVLLQDSQSFVPSNSTPLIIIQTQARVRGM